MTNISILYSVLTGLGAFLLLFILFFLEALYKMQAELLRLEHRVRRLQREQQRQRAQQGYQAANTARPLESDAEAAPSLTWNAPSAETTFPIEPYGEFGTRWLTRRCGERFYDDLGNLYEATQDSSYDPHIEVYWTPAHLVRLTTGCCVRHPENEPSRK